MEIKQEQDTEWHVDSMWVVEAYDPYEKGDVSTNSVASLFEDEHLKSCSCNDRHHSDCHDVVQQKDFYITQQPDRVNLNVFTESGSEHRKSTSKNEHNGFLDNIKLGIDTFTETITGTTKTVCDSEYQLVNTEIIINKFQDNVDDPPGNSNQLLEHKFDNVDDHPGNSSQLLEHEFGVPVTPCVDLLSDARRKLSNEIDKLTVCDHDPKDCDQLKTDTIVQTAVKPYKCGFCGLHFRWNSSLKRHKRMHTRKSLQM